MKKFYYFLFLLISFISVNAQIVNIPDANFKAKLLEADVSNDIARNEFGQWIKIDLNDDNEIQISEAIQVYYFKLNNSEISNLEGIDAFENLLYLECGSNNLVDLNALEGLDNLVNLQCFDNLFTDLYFTGIPNLELLSIGNNDQITSISFNGLESLTNLTMGGHSILAEIDLSPLTDLETFNYGYCPLITDLDFSNNYYLTNFPITFQTGETIRYINIKNGSSFLKLADFDSWNILENTFYCVDPDDLIGFNFQYLPQSSQISVYCSAYNGANYNTIEGNISVDINNNGNCDGSLIEDSFLKVKVSDGITDFYAFANSGNYKVFTQEGNYTVSPQILENFNLFISSPVQSTVNFPEANNSTEIRDFCLVPVGESNDVEIVISPLEPARPGFDAVYKVFYRNKGNHTISGDISFDFFGDKMDFITSDIIPITESENNLTFDFQNLIPFESREILLTFNINAPTDIPPVNIGDWLSFIAEIEIPNDIFIPDNKFTFRQEVVGSYDPNDILCLEGESVDPEMIGEELHYRIRFENTGNFPAERVVVAMPINSEEYDVSSFQLLNTSHPVQARVVNNTAEFFFENINLLPNGGGDILLSMKSLETLSIGDAVMSYADIYFDYNFPITTNEAETVFEILGVNELDSNEQISVYPNPVKEKFTIKSDSKINQIEFYDVVGRLLKVSLINDLESIQTISSFSSGTYFVKIYTERGITVQKIIKR